MRIIFGMALDGYEHIYPRDAAGEVIAGPYAMLDILETRLGLKAEQPIEALRIVQYLNCLKECDDGNRFYSRSLKSDELVVAKTLLDWRDTWIGAGWSGKASQSDSKKIKDLSDAEIIATKRLSPGIADRLWTIFRSLQKGIDTKISVEHIDDLDDLPSVWQKILSIIPATQLSNNVLSHVPEDMGTDLEILQHALLNNMPCTLKGDGSVLFVSANAEMTLAKALPHILAEKNVSTTILNESHGDAIDMAFLGADLPTAGLDSPSRWRPQLQVLPLALSLIWEPLDPYRLLEFLVNPVAPLPAYCRQRLADVVVEFPGINGDSWMTRLEEIKTIAIENAEGDQSAGDAIASTVKTWLQPERYDPEQGAPVRKLAERCAQVARWAVSMSSHQNITQGARDLFYASSSQSSMAAKLLDEMGGAGIETIGQLQLNRLVDQVTAQGIKVSDFISECGHVHITRRPDSFFESVDRVIWWNFTEPMLAPKWPWSPAELAQLNAHGVEIPPTETLLQRQAHSWLLPVMAARQQLILTFPRSNGNESSSSHPLWSQIYTYTNKSVPIIDIDTELSREPQLPFLKLHKQPIVAKELPSPKRWWDLSDGKFLQKRRSESYSSLNAFIYSPYQWVLNYKAKIRAGSLAQIQDDARQQGNLLHTLLEKLFTTDEINWHTVAQKDLEKWIDVNFLLILKTEGANYLLHGKTTDREHLFEIAKRATWVLLMHLRSADAVTVEMEKHVEGVFCGGNLGGFIDMLVTNAAGREVVLDLKLGNGKYRAEELKNNLHLQLAVYASMRRAEIQSWPDQAYYIFIEARMLAQDNAFFPDAEICEPPDGENIATLWQSFEETWKWRRSQLDRGLIELTVVGTEPDDESTPPVGSLEIGDHNDRFNDYATITGWEENV